MGYGPKLTAKQRKALLKEIQNFDEKSTLAEIEREAVGKRDINAYEEWCDANGGIESIQANPDLLSENIPQPWGQRAPAKELVGLSKREKEAIEFCERAGLSLEDTALEMGISVFTVRNLLTRARRKLRRNA